MPSVQTWIVKQVASNLSKKLHTKVSIEKVDFAFFYKLELDNLLIEDRSKDTLLFAGAAKININDWFFTKDKIILKYIGLNNAVVNLNRTKEEWNYQFILDYFTSSTPDKTKSKKEIIFDFKNAEFNNIKFNRIDKWLGEDMHASIKHLDATFESADLIQQKFIINKLNTTDPHFSQTDYTGNIPLNYNNSNTKQKDDQSSIKKQNNGWTISIHKMKIENGLYQNDIETERKPYTDYFDGLHLQFNSINGELTDLLLNNNTLTANINLSANERNGFKINKIVAKMKFTPSEMEFRNLDILTDKSHIGNYYSMHYKNFRTDMNNFISNVTIDGDFKNSKVSSDDIAFFAPEVKTWNRSFLLTGHGKGTIDHFDVKNMNIITGKTTVNGDLEMKGLPDINTTFIVFNSIGSNTTYDELASTIPSLKNIQQPRLDKLGAIYYKGRFTGFISNFVASGLINTDLGSINSDINIKLPEKGLPIYRGSIVTTNFKLGEFANSKQVGRISLDGKIEGSGFSLKDLKAKFSGYIPQIEFNGYNYQKITANGNFENSKFNGHLSMNDSNLNIKNLDGLLTLSGDEIAFKLTAELQHANLKNIKITDQDIALSGKFSLDFTGNNIDNFLGQAKIYDATLLKDNNQLSFNSLSLTSKKQGDKKSLSLFSNEIEASVTGLYKILELPDAFKFFLNKYYPAYIKTPDYEVSKQDFSFNIKTKNIEEYLKIFDKRLSGGNNAVINGKLNLANNELNIHADIPEMGYEKKTFNNILLEGIGSRDTLKTNVSIGDIGLSDSMHFPETKLQLISNNDVSEIHLKTSASSTLNDADLNASVQTYSDGVKIHFYPSSFIVNDKKWLLDKDGELTIRNDFMEANEIKFSHKNQQIAISTALDNLTNQSHLIANLSSVNLEDFVPFAFTNPSVKGRLTGTATINDPLGKPYIDFIGRTDSLSLEDRYIGNINLNAIANTTSGAIEFHAKSNDTSNIFSVNGSYNYKDSTETQLDVNLIGEKINLKILEPYLGDIFSSIEGSATSYLKISGNPDHKYLTGNVVVKNSSLKVAYTQCRYFIENQTINFGKDIIELGMIRLKDSLNNTASLIGKIHHHLFDDLTFENVKLETAKLALLHTNKKDNAQFYGNIIGRAGMSINGPLSNLQMDINGAPSELDSSHIYLITSEGKESNSLDYIDFVQFGSRMKETKSSQSTNIVVNLKINANPSCQVDVILDEETGDVIKGQGNGLISIRVGNVEPLSIRGTYKLTKGEYTFNFQTFFKKPFTLNRGSITWNGDPYQAIIDIDAEYLAKNVDISNLSSSGGFKQKEDVKIISHLTGVLQNPKVKFDFELPERSDAKRDDIIVKRLADFKNDENEMNKQVASLLLFNSFIVGSQNFLSQGNASTLITNTIGGVISNLLTNFFNKELEKATKGILSTYIDINPTLDLQKTASLLQANIRAGLKILLNNRLVMLVGGNLDYNNPNYAQQIEKKGLLTPDITIEWLINKDGTLRVVGFNRSSIDFTLNQRNRSGLQLSYRKDMNKLSDIFKSKKKIAEEDKSSSSPAIKPEENEF